MTQQLIQKPTQPEKPGQDPKPAEPETKTREETELDFAILDTNGGITVERTATTFAAQVTRQDGQRQITINEDTDTTVFTIDPTYDVELPDAWEQLGDHMPTMTVEHTAAWDVLALHFMMIPAVTPTHDQTIDQFAPVDTAEPDTVQPDLLLDTAYGTTNARPTRPAITPADAYPERDAPATLYQYAELVDITTPDPVQLSAIVGDHYSIEAETDVETLLDDQQDATGVLLTDQTPVQYNAGTDAVYQPGDMEQMVIQRQFDADESPYGLQHQLSYTVSADTSGNAAEAVERLFAQTDLSGSVEKMTYQDTEDGYREKESYWVDIDGMDMERTEFFINGELAEDSLDEYSLNPGDSITFVEADLFDSSDGDSGGACGGDLYLDDVLDEDSDDEGISVVYATYGPDSPVAQQSAQPVYMTGA